MKKKKKSERRGNEAPAEQPRRKSADGSLATIGDLFPELKKMAVRRPTPDEPVGRQAPSATNVKRPATSAATADSAQDKAPAARPGHFSQRSTASPKPVQPADKSYPPTERLMGAGKAALPKGATGTPVNNRPAGESGSRSAPRRPALPVTVGVDMGTSTTKVVWRDELAEVAYPVCFGGHEHVLEDYLLPTAVFFDGKSFGPVQLGVSGTAGTAQLTNFKMCLACVNAGDGECSLQRCQLSHWLPVLSASGETDEASVVAAIMAFHLARVLALTKDRVINFIRSNYFPEGQGFEVRWSVNLAVPVKHMDEKGVLDAFESVLCAAWVMSERVGGQAAAATIGELNSLYREALRTAGGQVLDCFVYPEVAAEVVAMTLSRAAGDGLYAFADIGAGTLDLSIFRLYHRDDGVLLSFYAADVLRLGAAHLESIAARQLAEERLVPWLKDVKERRGSDDGRSISADDLGHYLSAAERWIKEKAERGMRGVLGAAWEKEMRAPAWERLLLLLGGGGAGLPLYSECAERAFRARSPRMQRKPLPTPNDFRPVGLPPEMFHRFAVAYGLSYDKVNLQQVDLPNAVEPLSERCIAPRARATAHAPTKDDV